MRIRKEKEKMKRKRSNTRMRICEFWFVFGNKTNESTGKNAETYSLPIDSK